MIAEDICDLPVGSVVVMATPFLGLSPSPEVVGTVIRNKLYEDHDPRRIVDIELSLSGVPIVGVTAKIPVDANGSPNGKIIWVETK